MNCKFNKPGLNKFIPVDPITIKEPLNKDLKTFESTDEFTVFYRQNNLWHSYFQVLHHLQ